MNHLFLFQIRKRWSFRWALSIKNINGWIFKNKAEELEALIITLEIRYVIFLCRTNTIDILFFQSFIYQNMNFIIVRPKEETIFILKTNTFMYFINKDAHGSSQLFNSQRKKKLCFVVCMST